MIDNPSAKFSAEGSAGIINIILKKDRKAGYYGSVQVGADTRGSANTSFNFSYSSTKLDAFIDLGYRHRENSGNNESEQDNLTDGVATSYERHVTENSQRGNNFFSRAGFTWHVTEHDDLDGDWGVIREEKEPEIVQLAELSEKDVDACFYRAIIEYAQKHAAELRARTEQKAAEAASGEKDEG